MKTDNKQQLIAALQEQILSWQGYKEIRSHSTSLGFGPLESAFPGHVFPRGTIHEFITSTADEEAATTGFISGLLSVLMPGSAVCLWISNSHAVFPAAIQHFGVHPDRIVFVCMQQEQDVLWALEEALKCSSISCVVAEVADLDFVQSRRLQLAVEKSRVTGFVFRKSCQVRMSTVCSVRWQIKPRPSMVIDGLPGVGFPVWDVQLSKVKNGHPSRWQITWKDGRFDVESMSRNQHQAAIVSTLKVS